MLLYDLVGGGEEYDDLGADGRVVEGRLLLLLLPNDPLTRPPVDLDRVTPAGPAAHAAVEPFVVIDGIDGPNNTKKNIITVNNLRFRSF